MRPRDLLLLATAGGNPPDVSGLWSFDVSVYSEKGALIPLDVPLEEAGIGPEDVDLAEFATCRLERKIAIGCGWRHSLRSCTTGPRT